MSEAQKKAELQDGAPPVQGARILQLIREELGSGPDEVFADFTLEPLASASIGDAFKDELLQAAR